MQQETLLGQIGVTTALGRMRLLCPSRADTHVLETSMAKGTVSAASVYELEQLNYSSSN